MIDLEKMFEKYDDSLLNCLTFEIRINSCKIVTFYDIEETDKYINIIHKKYNNFRWFVLSDRTIVFDFYNEKVKYD